MINDQAVTQTAQRIVSTTPLVQLIDAATRTLDRNGILTIADQISGSIAPLTPCKNGCSHCCYMGVLITDFEAEKISEFTNLQSVKQSSDLSNLVDNFSPETYATVPCTFLVEGKCSIYPVRPLACRLHHNLAQDESNCKISLPLDNMEATPSINLNEINFWFANLALRKGEAFADIRDYFPMAQES